MIKNNVLGFLVVVDAMVATGYKTNLYVFNILF
jgi:hypothetical protein